MGHQRPKPTQGHTWAAPLHSHPSNRRTTRKASRRSRSTCSMPRAGHCGACFGALYNGLGPCRLDAVANMRAEVEISLLQDFPLAQALGALLVSADDWEIIMHCRSVPLTYGVLMTRVLHNGRKFKQATLKTPSLDKCASRKSTRRSTSGSLNARGSACELVRAPFLYRFPLFHPCFVSQKAYAPGFRSIPRPAKQGRRAPAHNQRCGAHHSQTAELCFFDI